MSDVQAPPPLPPQEVYHVHRKTDGTAIASMVLGIVGVTSFPFIPSIIAVVLGYTSRKRIREHPDTLEGSGYATSGIVLGWIGILFLLVFTATGLLFALHRGHCGPFNQGRRFILPWC
ncbi:MAG: DUF4190 domain-containing protein [Actinomycetota bacterium]